MITIHPVCSEEWVLPSPILSSPCPSVMESEGREQPWGTCLSLDHPRLVSMWEELNENAKHGEVITAWVSIVRSQSLFYVCNVALFMAAMLLCNK